MSASAHLPQQVVPCIRPYCWSAASGVERGGDSVGDYLLRRDLGMSEVGNVLYEAFFLPFTLSVS